MIWIVLGLVLWIGAHTFKRWAPGLRQRMGDPAKGLVALASVGAIVLMVIGYRSVETVPLWYFGQPAVIANNLLMILSVALFGLGSSKSRFRGRLRHPMLTGLIVWVVAHLLVNGDLESLVMFGGLGLWAMLSMALINRAEPAPEPYLDGTAKGDMRLAIISLVIFVVIVFVHVFFGLRPYP